MCNLIYCPVIRLTIETARHTATKILKLGRHDIGDYAKLALPAKEYRHGIGFAISARLTPLTTALLIQFRLLQAGAIHAITAYASHSGRPLTEVDSKHSMSFRDLAQHSEMPPHLLEQKIVYADDADFICRKCGLGDLIRLHAPAVLSRWSLQMNSTKTELTTIHRHRFLQ
ncbi:hypothetical protein PHMEG_00029841 [Phytophthora megakarya]|uniref:Uncharacterized protein n=1 Tax=Phytophthora megakarya TaxID=4795 RepID=A0A225V1N8_9STRA|nr:hypothetical protein PHMEG_00029841 [Phytophthora megakarya]